MASNGMRVLTLVNCRLTAVEASYLAEYLQAKSCALEELECVCPRVYARSTAAAAALFLASANDIVLIPSANHSLKDNAIGGKGAVSLLKGLQHNHRLKSLVYGG